MRSVDCALFWHEAYGRLGPRPRPSRSATRPVTAHAVESSTPLLIIVAAGFHKARVFIKCTFDVGVQGSSS